MAREEQVARLLRIVQILANRRGGVTVGELAEEQDCSPRTIYRDLEALQMAGFPVFTDKLDQKSVWKFVDGYRLYAPIPFTANELMALHYSRSAFRLFQGTIFDDSFESLHRKIRSSLTPETLRLVERFENVFEFGPRPGKDYHLSREIILQVNKAASERRQIEMVYYTFSRDAENLRRVDPYRIWYFEGSLYLIAFCQWRKQIRMFALDRIRLLNVTEQTFEVPEDFSLDKYMANCFRLIQDELVEVKLRFSGEAARWIRDRKWHPSQEIDRDEGGPVTATYRVAGTSEIKRWILGFGPLAEVLEPAALRIEIASEASGLASLYAKKAREPARSRRG